MSSRPFLKPFKVFDAASMATSLTSTVTIKNQIPMISYGISWTGTPTGVFSVEVSDDYSENADGSVKDAGTWTTLPLTGTPPAPAGSADHGFIDIVTGAYAIRLVYTRTSGTGALTAKISGMVL